MPIHCTHVYMHVCTHVFSHVYMQALELEEMIRQLRASTLKSQQRSAQVPLNCFFPTTKTVMFMSRVMTEMLGIIQMFDGWRWQGCHGRQRTIRPQTSKQAQTCLYANCQLSRSFSMRSFLKFEIWAKSFACNTHAKRANLLWLLWLHAKDLPKSSSSRMTTSIATAELAVLVEKKNRRW